MRRILAILLAAVVVLGLLAYGLRTRITERLMERVVARNMLSDFVQEQPDGLHVVLCGAGSPLPDPDRSGPCTAVIAGQRLFGVDAGTGGSRILARLRIPQGRVEAVLLTHFHSDHIDGLGELLLQRWVGGAHATPVPVFGPPGVESVVSGFEGAYAADRGYRVAHHGERIVPPAGFGATPVAFPTPAPGAVEVLVDDGGLRITAFQVDHEPVDPAVGYRFDYAGRSVLISGDTKKSANLQAHAKGVDLLVHEALAPQLVGVLTRGAEAAGRENLAKITRDILDYHTTPVEAAEVARDAGVGHLLFHHIVPPLLLPPMVDLFVEGVADAYPGPFTVGRDGTFVRMPAGSDVIAVEDLL